MKTKTVSKITAEKLLIHLCHEIEIVSYVKNGSEVHNISIECINCNEVLCDFEITEA